MRVYFHTFGCKANQYDTERMRQETEDDRQRRLEETKRQIDQATQQALGEIRRQVASLTLIAAEKVTRKSLTSDDVRRRMKGLKPQTRTPAR